MDKPRAARKPAPRAGSRGRGTAKGPDPAADGRHPIARAAFPDTAADGARAGRLPIPYGLPEWKRLYRSRGAVEREFGRLKHDYALAPLRVRGLARVSLHADLCILGRLALALARARAVPLAA